MRVSELIAIEADPQLPVLALYKGKYLSTSPSSTMETFYIGCWQGATTTWGRLVAFASGIRMCQELDVEIRVFKEQPTSNFTVSVEERAVVLLIDG